MSSNEATRSKPVKVIYQSLTIPIPDSFLVIDPLDAKPITAQKVNWRSTPLPEYDGSYAVVLDNVLSPSECDTLLQLAEDSVADRGASGTRTWRPALVNFGAGYEILRKEYRNSDRIVWDNQTVANRLWARCVRAEGIAEELAEVVEPWSPSASSRRGPQVDKKWHFSCVNQRMRFLKYEGGQFFRRESRLLFCYSVWWLILMIAAHYDGPYSYSDKGDVYRTHYTIHLYLNDSVAEAGDAQPAPELVGGATSFLSPDDHGLKVNVNPKTGRVLIFQHKGLYHSGDEVFAGIKYTMRTDIIYKLFRPSEPAGKAQRG